MSWYRSIVASLSFPVVVVSPAVSQSADSLPIRSNTISASPIIALAGIVNLDYERRLTPIFSLGVSGSYLDGAGMGDVYVRFYPGKKSLRGFSTGASIGRLVTFDRSDLCSDRDCDDDENSTTLGADVGYTWILGQRQRFVVKAGGGMKAFFPAIFHDLPVLPYLRGGVGIAF